jgi:hypothetical protein
MGIRINKILGYGTEVDDTLVEHVDHLYFGEDIDDEDDDLT